MKVNVGSYNSAVFSPSHCSNNEGDSTHVKVNVGSYNSAVFSPSDCSNNEGDSTHVKVNVGSYIVQYSVPRTAQTTRVIACEGKCRFLYSAVFSPSHCSNNEGDSTHVKVNVGSYIQCSIQWARTAQTTRVIAYEGKCRFLYSAVFSGLGLLKQRW